MEDCFRSGEGTEAHVGVSWDGSTCCVCLWLVPMAQCYGSVWSPTEVLAPEQESLLPF